MSFFGGFSSVLGNEAQKHLDQMRTDEVEQRGKVSDLYWKAIQNPETEDAVREHAFGQLEKLYQGPEAKGLFKQLREAYATGKAAHDQYHAQPGRELNPPAATPAPPAMLDKNAPAYGEQAPAAPQAQAQAPTSVPPSFPPPPQAGINDVMHAAYPNAATVANTQMNATLSTREVLAKRVGLKPGTTEYQRFITTGQFPQAVAPTMMNRQVLGSDLEQGVQTLDGSQIDPEARYDKFYDRASGNIWVTPSGAINSQLTPQRISYKDPVTGKHVMGWGVNGVYQDDHHNPLPPGVEVYDPSLQQIVTVHEGTHFDHDANGNLVAMPETTTSTRLPANIPAPPAYSPTAPSAAAPNSPTTTPVTPGAMAPAAATPVTPAAPAAKPQPAAQAAKAGVGAARIVNGPDGKPLHKPLSAQAKQSIGQATISLDLIDQIMPDLDAIVSGADKNKLWDSVEQRSAWEQYLKLGIDPSNVSPDSVVAALPNIDPRLAKLFPTIAMLQVVGAQPWLRNIRRFEFLQQVQQHLPDPEKDSPALMISKLDTLSNNVPNLIRAAYEEEGITPEAYKPTTVEKVRQAAQKNGVSYADLAHELRRKGFKITRAGEGANAPAK